MLSERNQTQEATYCMMPVKRNIESQQINTDRKLISYCQGLGGKGEWAATA